MSENASPPVVVVTGASSGIGRATARAFARRGASVALAARRVEMLEDAARECEALGGAAMAVATDMTNEGQVQALGRKPVERFGRSDMWFNTAGVDAFGSLVPAPTGSWHRVIDSNPFGYVHGARVALPLEMVALPLRLAGAGLTAGTRMLASIVPGAKPKPDSM